MKAFREGELKIKGKRKYLFPPMEGQGKIKALK